MNHYREQWIADWCQDNGWTDWFQERSSYWAFPPQAVMPVPIPNQVLRAIKAEKGFSPEERMWALLVLFCGISASVCCYWLANPLPLVFAFAFGAVVVAQMEDETLDSSHFNCN
jgi:hypothetical protein